MGMVLGVEGGSNDPHRGSLPQVTVQPTVLLFCGPLVMVAAMPAVFPGLWWLIVAGGVKPGVKMTMMGGGVEF